MVKSWSKVTINIEELGRKIIGSIQYLDAIVDPLSQTINVRVNFKNDDDIVAVIQSIASEKNAIVEKFYSLKH